MTQKKDNLSTEEKVINAALKEFARYGYDGARIDRIARTAKVNKAMIYYHFKGKEALYEKIVLNIVQGIFSSVSGKLSQINDIPNNIYDLIDAYSTYISTIDFDNIRMLLREISSGGKYFRKIALPNMVLLVIDFIDKALTAGKKENKIRDINPYYTFFQIVGGIVFFNSLRITLSGTELYGKIFKDNYANEFKENLISILKNGIEVKE